MSPDSDRPSPRLHVAGLTVRFGDFVAVDGLSLDLAAGERHALIGPNGAGKSSFIHALAGTLPTAAGEIRLDGVRLTGLPVHARVRHGLSRTFQINTLFPGLTVRASVLLAVLEQRGLGRRWWRAPPADARADADAWLARLGLADVADTLTAHLPYGRQRILEIALALATRPRLLVLDEPAAGVPTADGDALFDVLAGLPADVAVLFVEHDMDLVFRFARRVTVMAQGRLLAQGTPDEIAADERVRAEYLGRRGAGGD